MTIGFEFEQFKTALKEKWLDYYAVNSSWLESLFEQGYCYQSTSEGRRPSPDFTFAIITALEPTLKGLLPLSIGLNGDPECLLWALGLDFDPKIELEKRAEAVKTQAIETIPLLPESDAKYLNKIRQENIT